MNKLFIGNIPHRLSAEELKEIFAAHGEIISCVIINDRETGRPKGFGFIEFEDSESAKNALKLDGHIVMERPLRVSYATQRQGDSRGGRGGRDNDDRSRW